MSLTLDRTVELRKIKGFAPIKRHPDFSKFDTAEKFVGAYLNWLHRYTKAYALFKASPMTDARTGRLLSIVLECEMRIKLLFLFEGDKYGITFDNDQPY